MTTHDPARRRPHDSEDTLWRSALQLRRRMTRGLMAAAVVVALQACGGSAGDAEPPAPTQALPTLSGRVMDGSTATDVAGLQVTIKGNVGRARTAEGRLAATDGSDYLASLDQLSGPYLLTDSAASSFFGLYSVATGPGTANLTPLTTLLVAQLLGAEPGAVYATLGTNGGFTAADDASIAAAERRVRRYLQRAHGFEVPATLGPFVTTPFARSAGDPMFDTINALVAAIGAAGNFSAVVTAVAQESARCKVERVTIGAGAVEDDFCPVSKSNIVDAADSSVRVIEFGNRHGDTVALRLRGAVVTEVRLRTAQGDERSCLDAACSGVTVGPQAGDLTQTITFASTPLSDTASRSLLTGSLRTSAPGITLPSLPCTSNRFYLINAGAGTAEGYCATPDSFGLDAAGDSLQSGASRRTYTFGDGAGGPSLEVVLEGRSVVRALVYTVDPETGAVTPRYQCRSGGCNAAVADAPVTDTSLGVPVVLQPIRFARTTLAAVLPDGSLSTTDTIQLDAALRGFHVEDPSTLPLLPVACAAGAPTVTVLPNDQAQPIAVCEPDDTQGFELRSSSLDGDGNLVFSIANLLSDGAGSSTAANSLVVTATPAGAIVSVRFDDFTGPRYRCLAPACAGVSISAPNGGGGRTVIFAATVLQEIGTGGLVTDRQAALNGRFLAPPVP